MPPKKKGKSNENVYEKAEDLPEGRKKLYDSILEDIDKQVEARIEQLNSDIGALQKQIKSQFKVALLQQTRATRQLKVEDFYYKESGDSWEEEKTDLNVECAKLAVSISNNIYKEVKTTVSGANAKATATKKGRRTKKSSILASHGAVPSSGVRRSTRKRLAPSWMDDTGLGETPLASSTMTAAALGGFSTAKTTRIKGGRLFSAAQTPMITPKFDMATPLNRTVSRTAKADEKFLMSMQGSPVYVGGGGRGRSTKNENLIPVPIGNGQTLMVPADNPEVQPMIQALIKSCMNLMNK